MAKEFRFYRNLIVFYGGRKKMDTFQRLKSMQGIDSKGFYGS